MAVGHTWVTAGGLRFCYRCRLVWLKNEATQRLIRRGCVDGKMDQ